MSDVEGFLKGIVDDRRREEARALDGIFRDGTGWQPRLWNGRLLGYGAYDYSYPSERSGVSFATGFATSSKRIALHIMPGYQDFEDILGRLGKHRTGAACVYITQLENADKDALRNLIRAGLNRLRDLWPVTPS